MNRRAPKQYCTFLVAGRCFGIEVPLVQEVLRHQEMTRVPLAPPVVRGLINLRGQIVAALDLRLRLGFPPRAEDAPPPMNVVVRGLDFVASLLVDEIGDVIEVSEASFEPPPSNMEPRARDLIRGIFKLEHGLMLVLDTESALNLHEVSVSAHGA